jgi:hypothetical protein
MGVVNVNSTSVTNANATPRVQNARGLENGEVVRAVNALVTITSGDSANSIYRIGKIRSSDFVDRIRCTTTADMGTTTAADIGLYDLLTDANGGSVVDQDFFASAVSFNAGAIDSDVTFEAAAAGGDINNGEKRVWEMLGLSSDPRKEYHVALTLTGACDGTGKALVRVYVVR